jgi:lysosomal acid lipase/cholesteryl ester hydrolase
MKIGIFQMFDDSPPVLPGGSNIGYHVPHYPTKQITTPIALFYGGMDTLPDMKYIIENINEPVCVLNIEGKMISFI